MLHSPEPGMSDASSANLCPREGKIIIHYEQRLIVITPVSDLSRFIKQVAGFSACGMSVPGSCLCEKAKQDQLVA